MQGLEGFEKIPILGGFNNRFYKFIHDCWCHREYVPNMVAIAKIHQELSSEGLCRIYPLTLHDAI